MEVVITLRDEGLPHVRFTDDEGGVIEKEVLPETLHQLISNSAIDEDWQETPLLPPGCIRYARHGGRHKLLIFVAGQARDTWLFDQRIIGLPFPNLIFGFVLEGQTVIGKYVVAVKETLITAGTELYKYPYSNVWEDAKACWNGLPEIQEMFQTGTLPELFFGSPDNGHLFNNPQGYRELIERSMGNPFLIDSLVKRNETLADLWARL